LRRSSKNLNSLRTSALHFKAKKKRRKPILSLIPLTRILLEMKKEANCKSRRVSRRLKPISELSDQSTRKTLKILIVAQVLSLPNFIKSIARFERTKRAIFLLKTLQSSATSLIRP
jgi:hypothetical protein